MKVLELQTEERQGFLRVSLEGELDIFSERRVEAELLRIEESDPAVLVLDLRGLDFLDPSGLRLITEADDRAQRSGRRLAIVPGTESVQRVFRLTGLDQRFDMVDDPSTTGGRG